MSTWRFLCNFLLIICWMCNVRTYQKDFFGHLLRKALWNILWRYACICSLNSGCVKWNGEVYTCLQRKIKKIWRLCFLVKMVKMLRRSPVKDGLGNFKSLFSAWIESCHKLKVLKNDYVSNNVLVNVVTLKGVLKWWCQALRFTQNAVTFTSSEGVISWPKDLLCLFFGLKIIELVFTNF